MKKKTSMNWELILAIIGALSWLPTIAESFKKTGIVCKIISQYGNIGHVPDGTESTIFLQNLAIYSRNSEFPLKDIKIYIKYPDTTELECRTWIWRNLSFIIDNKQKWLNISPREYLLVRSFLPKDEVVQGYLSFSVNYTQDSKYEYIRYVFEDFRGNTKGTTLYNKDINDNILSFDDGIWKE